MDRIEAFIKLISLSSDNKTQLLTFIKGGGRDRDTMINICNHKSFSIENSLLVVDTILHYLNEDPVEIKEGDVEPKNPFNVTKLRKYDVIKTSLINSGSNKTKHWAIVVKVENDLVYCITITSKEIYGKIKITKSRMFSGSYFCPYFSIIPHDIALNYFEFIYDKPHEVNKAIAEIKSIITNL